MSDIKQYEPLWGSWHVDSLIGEGSFGKVYKVHKEEFGQVYYSAVKIISIPQNETDLRQMRSEGMDDASARSYYQALVSDIIQEIRLMSDFRGNSNIVSFEDHKVIERQEEIGWDILIRMELLTGLNEHAMEKPFSQEDIIKLGVHICRALELCAQKNTIHRDIKPDNIFVSRFGEYKLGDFGIARQIERTMSGLSKKGTYTYMAPEVFKGEEYGASVDTYSLGIVMYRFLNRNRTPFLPEFPTPITPRDRDEALQRRMKGEAPPPIPGVSPAVNAIMSKMCAFDRKQRFSSPTEVREVLENALSGRSASVASPAADARTAGEAASRSVASAVDRSGAAAPPRFAVSATGQPAVSATGQSAASAVDQPAASATGRSGTVASSRFAVSAQAPHPPLTSERTAGVFGVAIAGEASADRTAGVFEAPAAGRASGARTAEREKTGAAEVMIGQSIDFGSHKWRVLDIVGNKALIITEGIITVKPYSTKYEKKPWQTCSLRQWLNGEFYNRFSLNAQMRIANTSMAGSDKIFLLSLTEIHKYFPDNKSRIARLTAQAAKEMQIWAIRNDYDWEFSEGEAHWWWVLDYSVVHIDGNGSFRLHSIGDIINELGGVRPALWLNLDYS
ncbi:MAG: protein kinase [Peptococcaceae bacterium]|nr:protein kinase [Peptococcaceae bacterium]